MTERDRKQIVSEVYVCLTLALLASDTANRNILKDLHHEHIVRYHDRYVDRDAGVLYILMEYCGGGDLSSIIKHAQRHGRPIPEDTIWNYFMQILLALNHCHHPQQNGGGSAEEKERERRQQILHRDLKPDNGTSFVRALYCYVGVFTTWTTTVFLDENNTVKLGDFGLSKALAQASFANTYVGVRFLFFSCTHVVQYLTYTADTILHVPRAHARKGIRLQIGYMVARLSDIRAVRAEAAVSRGEDARRAQYPHQVRTFVCGSVGKRTEVRDFVGRNGRIPPLPKGYSPALSAVIKAMLNLNVSSCRRTSSQLLT